MLKIEYVKIDELKPAGYNPRKWDNKAIEDLKKSIERFGVVDPIIVNSAPERKNIVIGGHFRLKVAKEMGIETVPVVYVNIPDIGKEKELNLRLNRNLGDWDYQLLSNFDENLLLDVGFESEELDKIFYVESDEDNFDAEAEYQKIEEPKAKYGDIYQLGNHRLMCGDTTKREDVEKLMNGEKADMVFTDPPYNVGYDYWGFRGTRKRGFISKKVFNDKKSPEEYQKFIKDCFQNAYDFSKDSCSFYCWHAIKTSTEVRNGITESRWYISQTIIWLKNYAVFSPGQDYHRIYEPCYFGWKKGKKHFVNTRFGKWNEAILLDREDFENWLDVLYEKRDSSIKYQHPTQKPVRLAERAIKKHSERGGIVLDLFGGSGSTLIACEQLNRRCYMMELDPKYVDVIIKRWEKHTNKKAEKIE
jgi:DNA modification methylase